MDIRAKHPCIPVSKANIPYWPSLSFFRIFGHLFKNIFYFLLKKEKKKQQRYAVLLYMSLLIRKELLLGRYLRETILIQYTLERIKYSSFKTYCPNLQNEGKAQIYPRKNEIPIWPTLQKIKF